MRGMVAWIARQKLEAWLAFAVICPCERLSAPGQLENSSEELLGFHQWLDDLFQEARHTRNPHNALVMSLKSAEHVALQRRCFSALFPGYDFYNYGPWDSDRTTRSV